MGVMSGQIVYKLPKGIKSSQYVREQSIAYIAVSVLGVEYYMPITKELKKLLKFKVKKGKVVLQNGYWDEQLLDGYLRTVVMMLSEQFKEYLADSIYENLSEQMKDGLEKMYANSLKQRIAGEMEKKQKLLEGAKEGTTNV